jgi:ankyrin repeat protein
MPKRSRTSTESGNSQIKKLKVDNQAELFKAVGKLDIERVKEILAKGNVDLNCKNEEEMPLLHVAIEEASLLVDEEAERQRKSFFNCLLKDYVDSGKSIQAAHRLAEETMAEAIKNIVNSIYAKSGQIVELLLTAGVNPNLQDADNYTALHLAVDSYFTGFANIAATVTLLEDPRTNPNIINFEGDAPVHLACAQSLGSLLEFPKVDVNLQNANGHSLLPSLIDCNDYKGLKLAINHRRKNIQENPTHPSVRSGYSINDLTVAQAFDFAIRIRDYKALNIFVQSARELTTMQVLKALIDLNEHEALKEALDAKNDAGEYEATLYNLKEACIRAVAARDRTALDIIHSYGRIDPLEVLKSLVWQQSYAASGGLKFLLDYYKRSYDQTMYSLTADELKTVWQTAIADFSYSAVTVLSEYPGVSKIAMIEYAEESARRTENGLFRMMADCLKAQMQVANLHELNNKLTNALAQVAPETMKNVKAAPITSKTDTGRVLLPFASGYMAFNQVDKEVTIHQYGAGRS